MIDVEKLAISFGFTTPPRVKGGKFLTNTAQEKLKKKKKSSGKAEPEKTVTTKPKKVAREEKSEKNPEQKSRKIKKTAVHV